MFKVILLCAVLLAVVHCAPNPGYSSLSAVSPLSYAYYRPYSYWHNSPWYSSPWYSKYYSYGNYW
ncbi:hypothetical protein HUJ05_008872 [Dendroctonus ponderosae]|nr:hypothetical protein HUJ05_008872 [Dendroctonus ponderosae]